MKILIIGNPVSGKGTAGKRIEKLSLILKKQLHDVNVYLTKFAGDGKDFISWIKHDFERLVIVGGDGTVNEIINGIPDDFSIPIMLLPTGNANLLSKELHVPKSINAIADIILKGNIVQADYASMNGSKFLMVAGAGFDAVVTEEVKKIRKATISNLSYIFPVLRAVKSFKNDKLDVTVDGKYIGSSPAVIVSNVCNYAGIFTLAHEAGITTGCLDIIMLPKISLFSLIKYAVIIKLSKVTNIKGVKYIKGSEVTIDSDESIPVELDGDFRDRFSEVNIRIIPKSLPLIVK